MKTIIRWISMKRRDILCYSCGNEKCKIIGELMNNPKSWNHKTKRFRMVVKCSGYKEQIFDFNKKYWEKLCVFIYDWCYEFCGGKHNITQSNDGFDFMVENLTAGIIYNLVHRARMNKLRQEGEKYIELLERIK